MGLGTVSDETGELGRISGQVDRNRDAVSDLRLEVRTLQVQFEYVPTDKKLDEREARLMSAVDVKIAHVGELFTSANREQSKDLKTELQNMRAAERDARMAEQLTSQQAILNAINERRSKTAWWVLGIAAGVIVSAAGTLFAVWVFGGRG